MSDQRMSSDALQTLMLHAVRTIPSGHIFPVADASDPVSRIWNYIGRLLALLRVEDDYMVCIADDITADPTLFELQFIHLIQAVRSHDLHTTQELLHWLLPRRRIPLARRLLYELRDELDLVVCPAKFSPLTGKSLERRILQLMGKHKGKRRPRLYLVSLRD